MKPQSAGFFFSSERLATGRRDRHKEHGEQIGVEPAYPNPHIAAKTTQEIGKVKRLYGKTVQQGGETPAPSELQQAQKGEGQGESAQRGSRLIEELPRFRFCVA